MEEASARISAAKEALAQGGPRLSPLAGYVDLMLGEPVAAVQA